jgi:mannose-6-phosphate isomerase-like protein (cupin superfamily)
MITLDEIVGFIHNPLAYQQKLVSVINNKGEQIPLNYFNELYSYDNATIKVEGLERYSENIWNKCKKYALKYNHNGPITCHGFIAKQDSPSFGMHIDPDDVIIYCVEGIKTLIVNNDYIILKAGDEIHIPANTAHQALNEYAAFTLSFGLEKYLKDKTNELDVLP